MEIKSILSHTDIVKIGQIKDTQLARACATYGRISYTRKILNEEIYGRKKQGQLRKCWITDMEEGLRRQWQVTRDPALKAEVNRLQQSVTRRLNEWRNDQWSATLKSLDPKDQ